MTDEVTTTSDSTRYYAATEEWPCRRSSDDATCVAPHNSIDTPQARAKTGTPVVSRPQRPPSRRRRSARGLTNEELLRLNDRIVFLEIVPGTQQLNVRSS